MAKKKRKQSPYADLTWNDLNQWAGDRIAARGQRYHERGCVYDLAITEEEVLVAWVDGSERYATRVELDDDGLPGAICSCPYAYDCKHGVAVVLEYLDHLNTGQSVPKAAKNDERLKLLAHDSGDDESENLLSEKMEKEIGSFLKKKTKAQLVELFLDLARTNPVIARELADRRQLTSGDIQSLVSRLRSEIRDLSDEPAWRNHWDDEGHTPDYSDIRRKLGTLLEKGYADEILNLGEELMERGHRQVEHSHDNGETANEISDCMPVIVEALKSSSLSSEEKLGWAVDAVLKDDFDIFDALGTYLHEKHPAKAWSDLADRLLERIDGSKPVKGDHEFSWKFNRDRISHWAIHALERSGRNKEIIPLCEAEAEKTGSYERLVDRLIAAKRPEDAERWIEIGIAATTKKWPGTASSLRDKLRSIRKTQKNWPAVAAMHAEEFVRHPSRQKFEDCKKAAGKVKAWPKVRHCLLTYLETGVFPWDQAGWPLPSSGLGEPAPHPRKEFPMVEDLIHLAILEKKPAEVLKWYDRRPRKRFPFYRIDNDEIAAAIQAHAPDRAVAMWKDAAERLIATVKPSAYRDAAQYLRKAAKVMVREKKRDEWERYLKGLRKEHHRKRKLLEILDRMDDKPILKKR